MKAPPPTHLMGPGSTSPSTIWRWRLPRPPRCRPRASSQVRLPRHGDWPRRSSRCLAAVSTVTWALAGATAEVGPRRSGQQRRAAPRGLVSMNRIPDLRQWYAGCGCRTRPCPRLSGDEKPRCGDCQGSSIHCCLNSAHEDANFAHGCSRISSQGDPHARCRHALFAHGAHHIFLA